MCTPHNRPNYYCGLYRIFSLQCAALRHVGEGRGVIPLERGFFRHVMLFLHQVIRSPKRSRSRASATQAIRRGAPTTSHAGWSISAEKCACCAIERQCFHFTPRHPLPAQRMSVVSAEPMEPTVRLPKRPPTPFATTSSSSQKSWVSPQGPPNFCSFAVAHGVRRQLGDSEKSCFPSSGVGTSVETTALASYHPISCDHIRGQSAVLLFNAISFPVSVSHLAFLLRRPVNNSGAWRAVAPTSESRAADRAHTG